MRIFIIGSPADTNNQQNDGFATFCFEIGKALASKSIDLVLCSPYNDSADYHVIEGIKSSAEKKLSLHLYYPKTDKLEEQWNSKLKGLEGSIKVTKFRQESHLVDEPESISYSWLFCQLQGITNSDFVIVIGGKLSGSSNLLLRLADAQEKTIIPIKRFGGVGELFYEKKKYQLSDKFGSNYSEELFSKLTPDSLIDTLINKPKDNELINIQISNNEKLTFFISYSREKPAKADLIETILRRRNYTVIRDENNISASQDIPNAIKENILKSDIFIAIWCKEYACSPWCYDELNIALDSHAKEGKSLWIFRTDKTRIVHPKARRLLWYDVENREQIEGKILSLLGK